MLRKTLCALVLVGVSGIAMAGTPYAGKWQAKFSGGDHGHCKIQIRPSGQIEGKCNGHDEGAAPFWVKGFVHGSSVHFGVAATGARFAGYICGNHGEGTWRNAGTAGSWKIRKDG